MTVEGSPGLSLELMKSAQAWILNDPERIGAADVGSWSAQCMVNGFRAGLRWPRALESRRVASGQTITHALGGQCKGSVLRYWGAPIGGTE